MADFVGEFDPEMLKTNNQVVLHEAVVAAEWAKPTAQKRIMPKLNNQGKLVYDPEDWNTDAQKGTISNVHLKLYKKSSDASESVDLEYEISVIRNCHFVIYYNKEIDDPNNPGYKINVIDIPKPPINLCFGDLTVFHNCTFEPITYFGIGAAFSKSIIAGMKYESSFEINSPQSPSGITVRCKSPGGNDVFNPRIAVDPTNMVSAELQGIINQLSAAEADLYVPPSNLKS